MKNEWLFISACSLDLMDIKIHYDHFLICILIVVLFISAVLIVSACRRRWTKQWDFISLLWLLRSSDMEMVRPSVYVQYTGFTYIIPFKLYYYFSMHFFISQMGKQRHQELVHSYLARKWKYQTYVNPSSLFLSTT